MPGAAPCLFCSRRYHGFVVLGMGGCEWCLKVRRMPMVEAEHPSESRDGTGSGDHDTPFSFGHPRDCLTLVVQARLTIMRGYVLDVSHAPQSIRGQLRYGADDDWVAPTSSGLLVPIAHWPDEA